MRTAGSMLVLPLLFLLVAVLPSIFSASIDQGVVRHGGSSHPWEQSIRLSKRSAVQLCGARLVEAVRSICKGELFSGHNRKRSVSTGLHLRRIRRSISDKCCKAACSISDLVRYCGGSRNSSSSS
ncbi:unnamed protein product [Allacma fusca]|uniref:Insulin-like domain-containing protein n=1 Tax=Allacma fusca TaxID=39272 RepID=A0A8J2J8B9_9HEXA|nr:unnamed protein product [Allacma fusca]